MTNEADNQDRPQIHTDEDWKSRVKAEDAALEQKLKEEVEQESANAESASTGENPESESEPETDTSSEETARIDASQLPPADLATMITMFSTQAMVALGVFPDPSTGKAEPEPALAKHFIDLLGVLEEKTRGNLDSSEEKLLDNTLHQLRMAYVGSHASTR